MATFGVSIGCFRHMFQTETQQDVLHSSEDQPIYSPSPPEERTNCILITLETGRSQTRRLVYNPLEKSPFHAMEYVNMDHQAHQGSEFNKIARKMKIEKRN